eukprot:2276603-Rhodomonas_salina.1
MGDRKGGGDDGKEVVERGRFNKGKVGGKGCWIDGKVLGLEGCGVFGGMMEWWWDVRTKESIPDKNVFDSLSPDSGYGPDDK